MRYPIAILGCDDKTLVVLDLTEEEYRGIVKLDRSAWVHGQGKCQPVIAVGANAEEIFQQSREDAEFDIDYIDSYSELRKED